MANRNAIRLDDLTPADFADGTRADRAAFWRFARSRAEARLKDQCRRGIDRFGKRMVPVKRSSRPDGATGEPLDPHYAESRVVRRLRSSVAEARGGLTLWWSHGWGKILGYHAAGADLKRRGKVVGKLPVRDVLGLSPANERGLRREVARWWKGRTRKGPRPAPPSREAARLVARYPYLAKYLHPAPRPRKQSR